MEGYFNRPYAYANIKGGDMNPEIRGTLYLYQALDGAIVEVEVFNLPHDSSQVHGLHIHEGDSCEDEDFELTGGHYNPFNKPHPMHAGDLPPLFSNNGYAYLSVFSNRFKLEDVINKTIVIHSGSDDFKTQPSGDSGTKIACGKIEKINKTL